MCRVWSIEASLKLEPTERSQLSRRKWIHSRAMLLDDDDGNVSTLKGSRIPKAY